MSSQPAPFHFTGPAAVDGKLRETGPGGARQRAQFDRLAHLIKAEIGVRLPANKQTMVEGRLRKRRMALGFASMQAYFDHLFENGGLNNEMAVIVDAVTTNKTDFFREPQHFHLMVDRLVPQTLRNRPAHSRHHMLKAWSAAASTGAEVFTIAMLLEDMRGRNASLNYGILGTDVNNQVLATAALGIYPAEQLDPVPPELRARFTMQGSGAQSGQVRIVPELRQRTHFARLNLMDHSYPVDHDIDLIFLRNVLIYFDPADQARVIDRLTAHLVAGGHLLVGHSESMVVRHDALIQIAPAAFQKR
ncbi:CheR family methyltransferase [Rhodobacter ferrooxidans]|uniref:Chemotaxis protein methyltransferase n=1 Tax=Rhodobacter ferrooxidans TaxID=371731 RepID=C8S4H1_9RHOB|nr:CheR family methyltransferase [Rhodobacter sp. SW2]EEW24138.1 MCP methyltransferase, CheR-type [Rhodobacter sp. SW2]